MGYRINKKEIDLNKLQKIAQGKRGYVYRLEKNALKVLENEELNECIDGDTAKYLSGLRTDKILLPKNLLFYNNTFKGYTLKLVSQKPRSKNIISIPKNDFIRNVKELEEDDEIEEEEIDSEIEELKEEAEEKTEFKTKC